MREQNFTTESALKRLPPAAVGVIASLAALNAAGPLQSGPDINPIAAIAYVALTVCGFNLASSGLIALAGYVDLLAAKKPTGLKGSAAWVTRLSELKSDLLRKGWGPYWGAFKGKPVFADYASNALTIGTAGSGKGIGVVQPMILSIRESKTIIDFKGELTCVLASALRKRGEAVHVLNLGDLWEDIVGASDSYNPLCIISDNFTRAGGLLDISDDIEEMCKQLLPDPENGGGKDDNAYFRIGGRDFLSFAIQTCVLIDGPAATLGDAGQMLGDRASLLRHALWACGKLAQGEDEHGAPIYAAMPIEASPWAEEHHPDELQNYIAYYRALAASLADLLTTEESRTADSFITGAQQALRAYNISTRAHRKTKGASFRFSAQKESGAPTTVFIIADASKITAQKPVLGLLQWCMLQELKRHPNKEKPVYLIADEATNFKLADLGSLLTWGRGYGLRLHLIIQSLSAFREAYGARTADVLLSETEIKQFLPGQREPETLSLIEKLLGEQSVVALSRKGGAQAVFAADDFDFREEARALLTADEIRRMDKAILILRKNKPLQTDLPPIAAIAPFRDQIDVNPFHGKPFLKRVALRLKRGA